MADDHQPMQHVRHSFSASAFDVHIFDTIGWLCLNYGWQIFGVFILVGLLGKFVYTRYNQLKVSADYYSKDQILTIEQKQRMAWELHQAKLQEEADARLAQLREIEKKRAADKLEEMIAASEGRTSKTKQEPRDYRDSGRAWDGMGGPAGGGGSGFKPSGFRRRGG